MGGFYFLGTYVPYSKEEKSVVLKKELEKLRERLTAKFIGIFEAFIDGVEAEIDAKMGFSEKASILPEAAKAAVFQSYMDFLEGQEDEGENMPF